MDDSLTGDLWFAYDGDCPVCNYAAHALRIRRDVGRLYLVDARTQPDHPVVREINTEGLDHDTGMVLKFRGVLYHGDDALHMMALLGSRKGWFNRTNVILFRSKFRTRLCYPPMRLARNVLLQITGVDKLRNLRRSLSTGKPIFQPVFGPDWHRLPAVMKCHYAVRPFTDDKVTVEGTLDVRIAPWLQPLLRMTGVLVSQSGNGVPVSVTFSSGRDSRAFHIDRTFRFPGRVERFRSRMEPTGGNELIEFMRFGLGWKTAYVWNGRQVELQHRGYVWRIWGVTLPVPLSVLLGKGEAEEEVVSVNTFRMHTHVRHFLFGTVFEYGGEFTVREILCNNPS